MTCSPSAPHQPDNAVTSDLTQQFDFLEQIERLRHVERHNLLLDTSRRENSAEHSWHLALYALAFAPLAPEPVSVDRVIRMLLLHDIVEIDVGDHPIHMSTDWEAVARVELVAAQRIFGLLPQGHELLHLWQEFEAGESQDARFAKALDRLQPLVQTLTGQAAPAEHTAICRENLTTGRAVSMQSEWPLAYEMAIALLDGDLSNAPQNTETQRNFIKALAFVGEADRLKSVLRASQLADGSRHENSAEHSWLVMMFAWVLAPHSVAEIRLDRVLRMLLLHDLVEIDAGDVPIHTALSTEDLARIEAAELAAAARIFGLLPEPQGADCLTLWQEFEAAQTADAVFAKSIDRVQPVLLNMANSGGSWVEYNVTLDQLESRVGVKVAKGAPDVWTHVRAQLLPWFTPRDAEIT